MPRGDLLRGRQEPSVVRVHQHPTHRGAPPRLPRSCGPCGTVQVTRDLAERRAREKVSEDASHVGRLVLDDLEPGAVRVALRGGQPAVPVGRVAGAWVALLAPFDGVAARASGLDLHLALSEEDKLLEHEVVVLGVDSAAYGHDPDLALLAQFEHVGEAARETVHVHDDQHVELAPVIGREHVRPAGPGPSRLAPGGVIVLELV